VAVEQQEPPQPAEAGHRRDRWESRRREVVDVSARLFAERGYRNTSIDDLVEATGLQRGGLYHYIESKQHLLLLTHEELIEPLLAGAEEICASSVPPAERLRELLRAWVAHVATHRDHMIVFNEERRLIEAAPEWRQVRDARERFERLLDDVLAAGVDDGSFTIDDVDIARMSILGIVNHMPQWLDATGRLSPADVADRCADLLLQGMLGR
jgi:TetR/AcrR family transcriptional regulator, cholesterol catabolism regulator